METPNFSETNQEIVQETELAEVPDQLIPELLSRLPIKSLYRFKCVNKPWELIISDPKFTLKTNIYRAIFWSQTHPVLLSINHDLLEEKIPNPIAEISDSPNKNAQFLGSCNGLFLFCVCTSIYLWNPSTRSCREILHLNLLGDGYSVVASGICFDESIDDYKVVMMLTRLTGGRKVVHTSLKCRRWTDIDFPYNTFSSRSGPVVNGNLHWIIKEEKGEPELIIYFDSRTSRFIKLPMPDKVVGDASHLLQLGVLDGCLTLSRFGNIWKPEHVTEVLIMKDYGVKESWRMLCRIPLESPRIWFPPLFYIKGSKEDVLVSDGVSLVVFNLKDNSMKDVKGKADIESGVGCVCNAIDCCSYIESLQSLDNLVGKAGLEENSAENMDIAAET